MTARRPAGFDYPRPSRVGPDPVSQEIAQAVRDRRNIAVARELLSDPPTPEDEAESEGARSIARAAIENLLSRVRRGEEVSESDLDAVLSKAVNRATSVKVLQQLLGSSEPHGPVPNTAAELTSMATGAAQVANSAAQTAIERERTTREELTDVVAGRERAIAAAVAQERENGTSYMGLLRDVLTQQADARVAAIQGQASQSLARMEELAAKVVAAKDDTIRRLEEHYGFQLQIKDKDHAHELRVMELQHQLDALRSAHPGEMTSDEKWKAAQLEQAIEDLKNEGASKKRRGELENEILEGVRDQVLPALGPAANMLVGALTGKPVDLSAGAPPRPPEDDIDLP